MATLREIAEEAGVSIDTVSRVLNGKNKEVWRSSARRAAEIRRIAKRLGFRPNAAARAVRRGRFLRIACVVTRFGPKETTTHPNILSYLTTAADELAERNYSLVVEPFHLQDPSGEFIEPPRLFSELAVDGILGVAGSGFVPRHVDQRLAEMRVPLVWVNRNPEPDLPCVVPDERVGGRELTRHLVAMGHRRIAYVGPDSGHLSATGRYEGFLAAVREAGLDESNVILTNRLVPVTTSATRLFDPQPAVTAVVCYDRTIRDIIMFIAAGRGLRVPTDLSVAHSASAWELSTYYEHPMTSVEIPETLMAAKAVEILLDMIAGHPAPDRIEPIPGRLIPGETAVPPSVSQERRHDP